MSEPEQPLFAEYTTPEAPPRIPFWGYSDLVVFIGLTVFSLLCAGGISVLLVQFAHTPKNVTMVLAQFAAYGVIFGFLALWFRAKYGQPFWRSMAWVRPPRGNAHALAIGLALAFAIVVIGNVLRPPNVDTPMKQLLSDPTVLAIVTVLGTTIGPLCEELAFRGLMQPLFERSAGAIGGIVLAAIPFGLLHLPEYGYSWKHAVLITLAGAAFGWMRHRTGSTQASTLTHCAYNLMFFVVFIIERNKVQPHG